MLSRLQWGQLIREVEAPYLPKGRREALLFNIKEALISIIRAVGGGRRNIHK